MAMRRFAHGFVSRLRNEFEVELVGWTKGEFLLGLSVVWSGALRWVRSEREWPVVEAANNLGRFAFIISITSFVVLGILWAVSVSLIWLITTLAIILGQSWVAGWLQFILEALAFKYVLFTIAFFLPQCMLLFIRYWSYAHQDQIFVAALRVKRPLSAMGIDRLKDIADALEILPAESTWLWLRRYLLDGFWGWLMAIAVLALSSLRGIGPLIYQAALGFRRRAAIGSVASVALLALLSFPYGRVLSAYGLQVALMSRAVSKELLFPFLGRCGKDQRQAMRGRHQARIMGFGIGAGALLSIPIFGSLLWFDLVHAAGRVFGDMVLSEEQDLFSLSPAVREFREEEARWREEDARRDVEREARKQKQIEERAAKLQQREARQRRQKDVKETDALNEGE